MRILKLMYSYGVSLVLQTNFLEPKFTPALFILTIIYRNKNLIQIVTQPISLITFLRIN